MIQAKNVTFSQIHKNFVESHIILHKKQAKITEAR